MVMVLNAEDRAAFKRCRRSWDFHSPIRHNLEPVAAGTRLDADRMVRDALAVYYFPGMWDWSRGVVLPLVDRALDSAEPRAGDDEVIALHRLVSAYCEWAPGVERFGPVLVEVDYDVDLPDPDRPDAALWTRTGDNVRFRGRVDLLAVDEYDAYWIVRHRVVDHWTPIELLVRDEELLAACWAWEQFYLGMRIAGTIHNELRIPADFEPATPPPATTSGDRGGLPQHDASGGGRSIPQHRRLYAQSGEPSAPERITRDLGAWFRRTWIRRARSEIEQAGRQLASEAREILDPDVTVFPTPGYTACGHCHFHGPCAALYEGADAEAVLAAGYQTRLPEKLVEGRLGGMTWSTGRGAAPPRFRGGDRPQ